MTSPSTAGSARMSAAGGELLDLIAADPSRPLCVGVTAPGGYGKTTLLREVEAAYAAADVRTALPWRPGGQDRDAALLVDDAHLLDERHLRELRGLVTTEPGARLVVAYRPWPRPPALVELIEALRRLRTPVVLPPLSPAQVAACLAAAGSPAPPPALVNFVTAQTRGVPRYVNRLVNALADGGFPAAAQGGTQGSIAGRGGHGAAVTGADARGAVGGPAHGAAPHPAALPPATIAPFAADLDGLDPELRLALLAVEAGVGLHLDLMAALLGRDADGVAELMAAARATGLLWSDGTLVPLARHALAALEPLPLRVRVRQRLAALQLARGGPVLPLVRPLLAAGPPAAGSAAGGAEVAPAFEAAGHEALGADPALAAQLFAAATAAGRPAAARHALATALAGELESAARLADQIVAAGDTGERPEAAYVAAVALAHRGQLARSAELFGWAPPGPAAGFAVVGLVGTGRLADARRYAHPRRPGAPAAPAGPPTLLASAASLMARGVYESVTGSATTALSALVQAATLLEPTGAAVLLPDSPAALAALVALHCAEFDTAEILLDRAIDISIGGPLLRPRHLLLKAWLLMARGRVAAAEAGWPGGDAHRPPGSDPHRPPGSDAHRLPARERLFAAALRTGLARRASDLGALRDAWPEACHAVVGQPADLFAVLPLGELAVAAARLGDQRRLAAHLAEADAVLAALGDPPLWSVPLHWNRLHAAIIAEQPAEAERHAAALDDQRAHSPYAEATAVAAQSWLAVLAGRVEPESVERAARGLAGLGLAWDGARLAGQAAIRTSDRAAMTALLDCARLLQGRGAPRSAANRGTPAARGAAGGRYAADSAPEPGRTLSEREQQVAELVLAGLTYKQVGDRLYISAKTVEHHMARMRQRLGCTDRRDLLSRLRTITTDRDGETTGSGARRATAGSEV